MADSSQQENTKTSSKSTGWSSRSIDYDDNLKFESTPPGVLDGSTAMRSFYEASDRSHVHRKDGSTDSPSTSSSSICPAPSSRRLVGHSSSSKSNVGSGAKKPQTDTLLNNPTVDSESRQIIIYSEKMNDTLKHLVSAFPITVTLLNENNNYAPMKDLSYMISSHKHSIWIYLCSTENERFNAAVVELHQKRKELYENSLFLGTLFESRLVLTGGLFRKDLPVSLKNIRSLDAKNTDTESLGRLGSTITKAHDDRKEKIEKFVREKTRGGMFLHVTLTLTDNRKPKVAADSPIIEEASKSLVDSLTDTTTTCRIYFHKQFKCPHVKHVTVRKQNGVDIPNHEYVCKLELRIYESNAAEIFQARCKDGTVESIIREHSKVGGLAFSGLIKIELDDQQVTDVMQALALEEKVAEAKKIQRLLESDGASVSPVVGMVANSEGSSTTETPIAQKNAILMEIVENFIKDKTRTPYEFMQMLSGKFNSPDDWVTLRNVADYNIMHMAVINGRQDFLEMLFYKGLWGVFIQDVARPDSNVGTTNHMGYTPRRVAESFSYKELGQEMIQVYDKLDDLWEKASPIVLACLMSDLKLVHALADIDPMSLHALDAVKANCLFYACAQGNTDIVKFLLKKNVDPDKQNDDDETCVIIAAKYGHINVLEELSKFTFKLRGRLDNVPSFYNAVDYCALTGNFAGLEFFRKKNLFPSNDDRLLTLAAKNKQQTVLNKLLKSDSKQKTQDSKLSSDELGRTAIHYSALNADKESFKLLTDNTDKVTEKDIHGNNILHLAVESDSLEMVKLVVDYLKEKGHLPTLINTQNIYTGKDTLYTVRGKDKGRRAWHWIELKRFFLQKFKSSLKTGQVDVIQFGTLLRSGYGPIEDDETKGRMQAFTELKLKDAQPDMTPLHVALSKNSTPIALYLLDNGANPGAKDSFKATPMHYACMFGNVEILKRLEEMKVDLVPKMNDGKTPVQIAEINDQMAAVNFLEAKVLVLKTQQFVKNLDDTEKMLTEGQLNERRIRGRNVRRHMVDILRDLSIDVNVMLQELGSGPVLESSN